MAEPIGQISTYGCTVIFDPKTKTIKESGEVRAYLRYHCTNSKGVHPSLKNANEEELWRIIEGRNRTIKPS